MILRVEKEKFRSESGFTVLICDELDDKGKVIEYGITVTGVMLPGIEGTKFEAECELVNSKYGEQLKVNTFIEQEPDTKEGIIALILASKLRGIGKKTAEKIVNKFGMDTLQIMDNDFSRLKKIRGIPKDLEQAQKQWQDSRSLREMMQIVGNSTNITPNKLLKIKSYFKEDVVDVLKNHPYRIAEIKGITFEQADSLARQGIAFDSNADERIQCGIKQAIINAMENKGHMFLTSEELLTGAREILNKKVDVPVSDKAIMLNTNHLCKCGSLNATNLGNGSFAIYLMSAFKDETEPVVKILDLLDEPIKGVPSEEEILKAIEVVEKKERITLADKQKQAIVYGIKHRVSIITGGPGRGKTTTLNSLLSVYKYFYKKDTFCLMAPTGRAARRMRESTEMEASTIHSKLSLRGEDESDTDEPEMIMEDLIVIDEMSMVDSKLFNKKLQATRPDARIVFVGDVDQLPSVGAGNVFSELISSGVIPTTVLDVPFRQSEEDLIYINANLINEGNTNLVFGESFQFIQAKGEEEISDICCRLYDEIVDEYTGDLDKVALLTPFRRSTKIGSREMNLSIRDKVNRTQNKVTLNAGGVSFMLNDKVMQLKNINDDECQLSNGDVGYITEISVGTANDSRIDVMFSGVGEKSYTTKEEFEMLDLAYASTIHKSQGSEVEQVIMPMSMCFFNLLKRNLVYTGVSRAKKKVYIVGDINALNKAIKDNTYSKRNTLLGARLKKEYAKRHSLKIDQNQKETKQKDNYEQITMKEMLA